MPLDRDNRRMIRRPNRIGNLARMALPAAAVGLLMTALASAVAAQSNQGGIAPPPAGGGQVQVIPPQRKTLPSLPAPAPHAPGNALQIPSVQQPAASNVDEALSRTATDYLHHHRLPYVQAQVTRDASGAIDTAVLSGQVASDFGKQDAARKLRGFLNAAQLALRNDIEVEPDLQSGRIASNQVHSIPQAFFGCWRGTSQPSDSSQYLGGCPRAFEIPENQELCFRKVGDGGYEIAYQSASSELPNFRDHTDLISSNGDRRVELSDIGSYNMLGTFMFPLQVTFSGSSRCDLSADNESLACRGATLFRCGGAPWYHTTGRIVMRRVER
jgi:hypothetical protein